MATFNVREGAVFQGSGETVRAVRPENLLFRLQNISFENDDIGIVETAEIPSRERRFFERYQGALSWGGAGRRECANIIDIFNSLHEDLRAKLVSDFGMSLFIEGDRGDRIRRYFLRSRSMIWDDNSVLAPFIDQLHHSSNGIDVRSGPQGGLQIAGEAQGEIRLNYGRPIHLAFSTNMESPLRGPMRSVCR